MYKETIREFMKWCRSNYKSIYHYRKGDLAHKLLLVVLSHPSQHDLLTKIFNCTKIYINAQTL
jgi:hypothetical protein